MNFATTKNVFILMFLNSTSAPPLFIGWNFKRFFLQFGDGVCHKSSLIDCYQFFWGNLGVLALKNQIGILNFTCSLQFWSTCILLEGGHTFGVPSRFVSYSLYLYCTGCPGQLKCSLQYMKRTGMYRAGHLQSTWIKKKIFI